MHVKFAGVGVGNRSGHISVGVVSDVGDAAGTQIRFHPVGNQIHVLFFVAAVNIGVPFLRGWAEKYFRHMISSFLSKVLGQYRTKLVRKMRSWIFRQIA